MDFTVKNMIQVQTFPGLMDCLRNEVEALGYSSDSAHKTGLELKGSLVDAMRLNLHLRTALNVLFLLKKFSAKTADDVYKHVKTIPWEDIIDVTEYVSVVSSVDNPTIRHSGFPNLKVKDAIVDRVMDKKGARPDSGPDRGHVVVNFFWKDERCWIYLNSSGRKLSDRIYRKQPHIAPLREVLAAGIIMTTGYSGQGPLVLPMCGSGTLAIEAALIGLGRAPGLLRTNYGFMHVTGYDSAIWDRLRDEARQGPSKNLETPIVASDISEAAVRAALLNARTAGVDHLIDFHTCDFADTLVPPGKGIVVLNPEYGERMGEIAELEKTYKRIGDFFKKKCGGYSAYLFTGNRELAKKIGLKASRKIPFFNAKIECRLFKYDMYEGSRRKRD